MQCQARNHRHLMNLAECTCLSNEDSQPEVSERRVRLPSSSDFVPRSRTKHSSCLCRGYLYVFGGRDETIGLRDSWRYSIERHFWEKLEFKGNQPPHLEDHSTTAIDGKIIIFGGVFDCESSSPLWFVDVDNLKCSSVSIEETTPCPSDATPLSRRGHTACPYDGGLYMFGGFVDFLGCTDELWRLTGINSRSPRWELLHSSQNASKSFVQKNFRLSPDCPRTAIAAFGEGLVASPGPSPRSYHSATILRDDMYVHGGERGQKLLASFWRWSLVTGCWVHLKAKPSPPPMKRHNMIAASRTVLLVLGGGGGGGGMSDSSGSDFVFWGFDVNTSCWFKLEDSFAESPGAGLVGFVAVNLLEEEEDSGDGLSLVTLWNDSVGNVTEITEFSCSTRFSSFSHRFLVDSEDSCRPPIDPMTSFLERHREAAEKLSSSDVPAFPPIPPSGHPSPRASVPGSDIEMDDLDLDRRKLLISTGSDLALTFVNDSFRLEESNSRHRGFLNFRSSGFGREVSDSCNGHETSLERHLSRSRGERRHHRLALVGGRRKNRRDLTVSPMSVVLLTCDDTTFKICDIVSY